MTTLQSPADNVLPYATDLRRRCGPAWLTAVSVAQFAFGVIIFFISGALLLMEVVDRSQRRWPGDYVSFLVEAVSVSGVIAGLCNLEAGTVLLLRRRREPHGVRRV